MKKLIGLLIIGFVAVNNDVTAMSFAHSVHSVKNSASSWLKLRWNGSLTKQVAPTVGKRQQQRDAKELQINGLTKDVKSIQAAMQPRENRLNEIKLELNVHNQHLNTGWFLSLYRFIFRKNPTQKLHEEREELQKQQNSDFITAAKKANEIAKLTKTSKGKVFEELGIMRYFQASSSE